MVVDFREEGVDGAEVPADLVVEDELGLQVDFEEVFDEPVRLFVDELLRVLRVVVVDLFEADRQSVEVVFQRGPVFGLGSQLHRGSLDQEAFAGVLRRQVAPKVRLDLSLVEEVLGFFRRPCVRVVVRCVHLGVVVVSQLVVVDRFQFLQRHRRSRFQFRFFGLQKTEKALLTLARLFGSASLVLVVCGPAKQRDFEALVEGLLLELVEWLFVTAFERNDVCFKVGALVEEGASDSPISFLRILFKYFSVHLN